MADETQKEGDKTPLPFKELLDIRSPEFDCKLLITTLSDQIKNGEVDVMKAAIILKRMAKVSEEIKKDSVITELINREADKYLTGSQKTFDYMNAKITKMATYTYYDFSGCGHPELNAINEIIDTLTERKKSIEEELKLLHKEAESNYTKGKSLQQGITFGIDATKKAIVVENIPKLVWENSGEAVYVEPPRKVQSIGLKFMKV